MSAPPLIRRRAGDVAGLLAEIFCGPGQPMSLKVLREERERTAGLDDKQAWPVD